MDPVILAATNFGFVRSGLVENWWRSLENVGLDHLAQVACYDDESVDYLTERNIPAFRWVAQEPVIVDSAEFHSQQFKALAMEKLRIVADFLRKGRMVVFSDVDLVLLKKPDFETLLGDLDVVFQSDSPSWVEEDGQTLQSVCTGFYIIRPNSRTESLFTIPPTGSVRAMNDQPWLQGQIYNLRNEGLKWGLLPRNEFCNGDYWRAHRPVGAFMVHANWCKVVSQKIEILKEAGFWYLQPENPLPLTLA